jgi:hypothetical protein
MILKDNLIRKWRGRREVVVSKFEAVFRYWCEGTEEYRDMQQAAYKTLTHSLARDAGNS